MTQSRSFQRRSSQPITWLILTNKTVQENTQTKYNAQRKQCKMQQNKVSFIQSPLMTLSQKTRWAYSTLLPIPHGAVDCLQAKRPACHW